MGDQDLALCENLDARENIFLGREPRRGRFGMRMIASERMTTRPWHYSIASRS